MSLSPGIVMFIWFFPLNFMPCWPLVVALTVSFALRPILLLKLLYSALISCMHLFNSVFHFPPANVAHNPICFFVLASTLRSLARTGNLSVPYVLCFLPPFPLDFQIDFPLLFSAACYPSLALLSLYHLNFPPLVTLFNTVAGYVPFFLLLSCWLVEACST